ELRESANLSLRAEDIISDPELDSERLQDEMPKAVDKPSSRLQGHIIEQIINTVNQSWPKETRRLRIAEIRNSSGNSGINILSGLPEGICDYEILAMDDYSYSHAEELYRSNLNVTVSRFDPESSGLEQKYKEGEFDIVLLADGLHGCDVLRDVFTQVSYILASSGLMVVLERRPDRMTDLNMGLLNSDWWHRSSQDDFPISSRLHPEEWMYLLEDSGFVDTINITDEISKDLHHFVVISKRSIRTGNHITQIDEHTSTCLLITNDDAESAEIANYLKSEMFKDGVNSKIIISGDNISTSNDTVSLNLLENEGQEKLKNIMEGLDGPAFKLIYIATKEEKISRTSSQNIGQGVSRTNTRLCNFINTITSSDINKLPPVWLVTSGAVADSTSLKWVAQPNPYLSGLWTMGRVIRNEYPDIDLRMIDLNINSSLGQISKLLWHEIMSGDGEEEVIVSDKNRSAIRLQKCDIASEVITHDRLVELNKIYQLEFSKAGSIDNLRWNAKQRQLPALDDVEIEVKATGLNFRDIMYTSGLLPPEMLEGGLSGATLGLECSGIITRKGEGVEHFEIGDEVIALAPAC
ncbi:MAG: alcohol dehydrogenase catalytic domain-containing protein, partial [Gammaproteobacteria bacterium]|nr:alcohol dehydrogenase catalytic domain-containing protein [Gammaproteobacteria bacterium]